MTEGVLVGPLLDYSAPLRHLADIRFNNPGLDFEILFRTIPELQRLRELRWFTWSVAELRCVADLLEATPAEGSLEQAAVFAIARQLQESDRWCALWESSKVLSFLTDGGSFFCVEWQRLP